MATASAASASQRFEATVIVICPGCQQKREIAARTERRHIQDGKQPLCQFCLLTPKLKPTEEHRWWWLEIYGCKRNGASALDHVRRHDLPTGLRELVDAIFGTRG
jgi:hypothetical protein